MKDFIIKLLFSKLGQPIAGAISVGAGMAVHYVAVFMANYLHYAIPPEAQTKMMEGIIATCYAVINVFIHKYAGDQTQAIQRAVGVEDDRWIGPETLKAVRDHVEFAKKPEVIPLPVPVQIPVQIPVRKPTEIIP